MRRLFVFGCSFTNYVWPTWADLLGVEFDYYENWGKEGIGNRAIAERVSECYAKNKFTKDDVVIVQWSSHLRYDWYKDIFNKNEKEIEGWAVHRDSPVGNTNTQIKNKIFSEKAFVLHTLNYIVLVQSLLKMTNCKWFMTGMGDIRNLGFDLEGYYPDKNTSIKDNYQDESESFIIWKKFPEFKFYENVIWNDNITKWLPSIFDTVKKYHWLTWNFYQDYTNRLLTDNHPSPMQHQIWLNQYLRPVLELGDAPEVQQKIVDQLEEFKQANKCSYDKFCDAIEKLDMIVPELNKPSKVWGF